MYMEDVIVCGNIIFAMQVWIYQFLYGVTLQEFLTFTKFSDTQNFLLQLKGLCDV